MSEEDKEAFERIVKELRSRNKELRKITKVLYRVRDMELLGPVAAAEAILRRLEKVEKELDEYHKAEIEGRRQ